MRVFSSAFFTIVFLFVFSPQQSSACGWDWVGECSSAVHFRINGTLDSFAIAHCPSGLPFNGLHLGTLQSLSLADARAITWESCQNNVSAVGLRYRVYEQGGPTGNFQNLNLGVDFNTVVGNYTTRYRSQPSNISLTSGLMVGKTYVVEIYFLAEIDTIGDDFIPETTMLRNNNGQNYKATFTYGGPNAAPFVVIPTIVQQPKCYGQNSGKISVSVWGDQTNLFYNWSNIQLNFSSQSNLPAGTYTVTVTGQNYTESQTIVLGQPASLAIQSSNVLPVNCGGGSGSATVFPGGGTPPYNYLWQGGQTTATATFGNSGNYSVSVTDANNCFVAYTLNVPGGGLVQQSLSETICAGGSIEVGGLVFDAPGVYSLIIPGNGGCDTMLTLTLGEIDPAALLVPLPSNILVTCNAPSVNLCANSAPNAVFQWSKDGIPATQTACLLATAGGVYTLTVTQEDCVASKSIVSEEHLVDPTLSSFGQVGYIVDCYVIDTTVLTFTATTNAIGAQFEWLSQGQVISTNDTFVLYSAGDSIPTPTGITLNVTDQYGCGAISQPTIGIIFPPMPPWVYADFQSNLCTGLVEVDFIIEGGNGPFTTIWNDSLLVGNEISLPPGHYDVVIIDEEGCISTYQVQVPVFFSAVVWDSPFPDWDTGSIDIYESFGSWFGYQWDNGETGSYLSSLPPGVYCVTITDQINNCAIDTCFTVQPYVSTDEKLHASSLQLSPNPAAPGDWVEIGLPENSWPGQILLELLDSRGSVIFFEKMGNIGQGLRLRLPGDLPSGIFLLRAMSANSQAVGKLMLHRE